MSEAEQQTNETLKRIQTVQELYGCLSAALTMEEAREERAEALTPTLLSILLALSVNRSCN